MARQSIEDRLDRLSRGACPIHGHSFRRIDDWYWDENFEPFTIVECNMPDCEVQAISYDEVTPDRLIGEHMALIGRPPGPQPKKDRPYDSMVAALGNKAAIREVYRLAEVHNLPPFTVIMNAARLGLSALSEALQDPSRGEPLHSAGEGPHLPGRKEQ